MLNIILIFNEQKQSLQDVLESILISFKSIQHMQLVQTFHKAA